MRFIVKIGSNLLTQEDNALNVAFIEHVAAQISILHAQGHEPLIVTSGAVAAGRSTISLKKESKNIPYRQLLAVNSVVAIHVKQYPVGAPVWSSHAPFDYVVVVPPRFSCDALVTDRAFSALASP